MTKTERRHRRILAELADRLRDEAGDLEDHSEIEGDVWEKAARKTDDQAAAVRYALRQDWHRPVRVGS